jgi:YaiO family outer membrane protein
MGLMSAQKKDYQVAIDYLKQVLNVSPDNLDAKIALIQIYFSEKHLSDAKLCIDEVVKVAPKDPRVIKIQADFAALANEKNSPQETSPPPSPLKEIQALRAKGKLDLAINKGHTYLESNPKNSDTDVILLMGLMMTQKQKYKEGLVYFNTLLKTSPKHIDAQLGMISIYMAQKEYKKAGILLLEVAKLAPNDKRVQKFQKDIQYAKNQAQPKVFTYQDYYKQGELTKAKELAIAVLKKHPNDIEASLMLARIAKAKKIFWQAHYELKQILAQEPRHKEALLMQIDIELEQRHDLRAAKLINQALLIYPNDEDILSKRATLYFMRHMYARAAQLDKNLLAIEPHNKALKEEFKQILDLSPHLTKGLNEFGANTQIDNVSGLKDPWAYSTFYYNYDTTMGAASLSMNNASRFGINANQAAMNIFPVFNKDLLFRFSGAYANQPILFPTYFVGAEAYTAALPVELSFGGNNSWIIRNIAFSHYTGSVSKEWKNYWFSFRPNYYLPLHGPTSILYTATAIRYFETKDTFFRITAGSGYAPNLADLLTVDFIIVNTNFVTATFQFPVFNHRLLMFIGGDYQHWVFQSNKVVWDISGAIIGLNYRFEKPSLGDLKRA